MARKPNLHYVNNNDFSTAVCDYVLEVRKAKKTKAKVPIVPDYIAESFLKIAEGLSHKSNFVRYTYREEMVMDAVENCLKVIENYNIEAATRTVKANAFAYFTQITWYAFLRRIAKEKKQQDIKLKYLSQMDIEEFIEEGSDQNNEQVRSFVEGLKERIDRVKDTDAAVKSFATVEKKKRKKRTVYADSDLTEFL